MHHHTRKTAISSHHSHNLSCSTLWLIDQTPRTQANIFAHFSLSPSMSIFRIRKLPRPPLNLQLAVCVSVAVSALLGSFSICQLSCLYVYVHACMYLCVRMCMCCRCYFSINVLLEDVAEGWPIALASGWWDVAFHWGLIRKLIQFLAFRFVCVTRWRI